MSPFEGKVLAEGNKGEQIRYHLEVSQLFEGLTDEELDRITEFCSEEVYEAGTTIFREGEAANKLYIVEEGRVALEMTIRLGTGSGRQGTIDVVTKGQAFGWWGGKSHTLTMSARCVEETKVIALDGVGLWHLLEEDYYTGYKVMKRLVGMVSSRLRHTRDTLAHVLSIASHDLKSPLAAVESYHQVMLGGYAEELLKKHS